VSNARLLSVTVERFKSFQQRTRIDLAPLTIILGRNNSGKSTLIQSILLLKQTLGDVRPDLMLRLDGVVDAFNLRELTYGWPVSADAVNGPTIALEWECEVDVTSALAQPRKPDLVNLAKLSGVPWLRNPPGRQILQTTMTVTTKEIHGTATVPSIELTSTHQGQTTRLKIEIGERGVRCKWNGNRATDIDVEFDHFVPHLRIDRGKLGPRDTQRAWHNAYLVLFAEPLQDLKRLLSEMHYLGSSRQPPPSLFKPTAAPSELGVSGELAAHLLHRRQREIVHFLPPLTVADGPVDVPQQVLARPLVEAVNAVMNALSVRAPIRVEEIQEVGFRVMFGDASLSHVGRGLGYLLPLVELGLFADPLRFSGTAEQMTLSEYRDRCGAFTHVALEEPEAHIHPKVASRLAHWLVSLAMANRRLIVETHSDHLVRRLRGLAARAGRDSELEKWLLSNVVLLSVEQDEGGRSTVTSSRLTAEGGVAETWPADFMDEATDEESAIYYARLDKSESAASGADPVDMIEDAEPEPDEAP
jgi:predicted ATPase